MRNLLAIAVVTVVLAGCGDDLTPEGQAAADERDIAMVEDANKAMAPLRLVTPEPILLPDIERYDLLGEACSYAPGTSFGARVIAREADAFMKIAGEIERFAADPGSRELAMHTRSVYNSKSYSLVLGLKNDGAEVVSEGGAEDARGDNPATDERKDYEGSVTLRDLHGRVVYEGVGLAQCRG